MPSDHEFFHERARQAREDAAAAVLDNVRERCLRSAAAWDEMAARAETVRRQRAETEARREAERMLPATGEPG